MCSSGARSGGGNRPLVNVSPYSANAPTRSVSARARALPTTRSDPLVCSGVEGREAEIGGAAGLAGEAEADVDAARVAELLVTGTGVTAGGAVPQQNAFSVSLAMM